MIVIMLLQVVLFCPFPALAEPETWASDSYETQTDFVQAMYTKAGGSISRLNAAMIIGSCHSGCTQYKYVGRKSLKFFERNKHSIYCTITDR